MSFQANQFVLGLTDLTPAEKAVAHTLACHAGKYGENSYPSMETIARESGLKSRRGAQKLVQSLEKKGIAFAMTPKTGGRGKNKATVYRLDLNYESPVNNDTTAALPDQQTVNPGSPFTDGKQRTPRRESVNSETRKREPPDAKQRTPVHTNSTEEVRRVSEQVDQHQSRVQEPLTPISNSKTKAHADGRDDEDKQTQTSVPDHQDQNQSLPPPPSSQREDSKRESVAAAASHVDRLQAEILRIPLSNGRTFQCNRKVKAIIAEELTKGRSPGLILQAAQCIARTLSDRDQMPGLTLADNLSARIIAVELEQAAAIEEQERRARAARDKKLETRRYELTKTMLIEQEERVGREYEAWTGPPTDFTPSDSFAFERYKLVQSLATDTDTDPKYYLRKMLNDKRLSELRMKDGESPVILASVEAKLAAEDDAPEPFY